jgi:1,4-alpha-glucan branching enzyme
LDVTARSKWAFWTMILTVVAFAGVPSWVLVESFEDYRRFFSGSSVRPIKARPSMRAPHAPGREDARDIHFVEFHLDAPEATSVRLAANFNGWRAEALELEREAGVWKIVVPLPPGTYAYAFEVDGKWTPDPTAARSMKQRGREASVRKVP